MTSQPVEIKNKQNFTLTDEAVEKVAMLLKKEGEGLALRVEVRPGGCSGFRYGMYFEEERDAEDTVTSYTASDGTGFEVLLDAESAGLLGGATLDYEDGLNGAGFKIDNPNAAHTCGCGNSFC